MPWLLNRSTRYISFLKTNNHSDRQVVCKFLGAVWTQPVKGTQSDSYRNQSRNGHWDTEDLAPCKAGFQIGLV